MSLFLFRFDTIKKNSTGITVYTNNPRYMDIFLRQHDLYAFKNHVAVLNDNQISDIDPDKLMYRLRPYKIKSNKDNQILTLISTQDLMTDVLESTCIELGATESFGSAITRMDIEVIKMVNELIMDLEYGLIFEYAEMDPITDDDVDYGNLPERMSELFRYQKGTIGVAYSKMYERFVEADKDDTLLPFTLEAYVSEFRELVFMEGYNDERKTIDE